MCFGCAIDLGASDVHFDPQKNSVRVRARVDGVLRDIQTLPKSMQSAVTSRLKIMGQLDIAERRLPQDGRASIRVGGRSMDLRVAAPDHARREGRAPDRATPARQTLSLASSG